MVLCSIPRISATVLSNGRSRPTPIRSLGIGWSRRSTTDAAGVGFGDAAESFNHLIFGMRVEMRL